MRGGQEGTEPVMLRRQDWMYGGDVGTVSWYMG